MTNGMSEQDILRAADKWRLWIQYVRMNLECPHCQALYDITGDVGDVLFVCHQCGQEFSVEPRPADAQQCDANLTQAWGALHWQCVSRGFAEPPWQRNEAFRLSERGDIVSEFMPETVPDIVAEALPEEVEQAPVRKTAHIWPWLLVILTLLAGAGFWIQKDAWLDNRLVRSQLINIGFDMAMRSKDWRIAPASVQPEWVVSRDHGSKMLLIHGKIINLLSSDMALPAINVVFFSKTEPDKQIGTVVVDIRRAEPGNPLHQLPYIAPARDTALVPALGDRNFTIMAESVPESTGDFTLSPMPR